MQSTIVGQGPIPITATGNMNTQKQTNCIMTSSHMQMEGTRMHTHISLMPGFLQFIMLLVPATLITHKTGEEM